MKNNKKKGFTLMELLIVIAIIVVLVAIAIPVFSGQLTKAKETTDVANIRSLYAECQTAMLSDGMTVSEAETKMKTFKKTSPNATYSVSSGVVTYTPSVLNNKKAFTWNLKESNLS